MQNYYKHETAVVDDTAVIGENTKIWINSQIRENVIIGKNSIISKDTYIDQGVNIGNNVKIQNGVSVYSGVTIENDVFVGPNVAFTNDMYPRATNADWEITKTIIKKGSSIGANSTIRCGIELGEYAMVGAGSVVTKDVLPYALMMGNPANAAGWVCKCGKRLVDKCEVCGISLDEVAK